MTRPLTMLIAAVALGATAVTAVSRVEARPPGGQDRQVFRARANAVTVDVAVRRGDRPLTGLTLDDFQIFDNGVPQVVTDFSYEKLPIDVTVALDISGSVDGPLLDRLRLGVQRLRTDLSAADRLEVLTFNHRVRRIADFADPAAAIDAAFAGIRAGGSSTILDTLAVALTRPVGPDRRHLVVLFSDGYDTSSINDPGVLLEVARRTTSAVHVVLPPVVGISEPGFVNEYVRAQEAARQIYTLLARETGGFVFPITPSDNLGSTFRRALDEFRSSYVLHFTPQGVERSGVHQIEVRVPKPSGVEVRARREYVAGGAPIPPTP